MAVRNIKHSIYNFPEITPEEGMKLHFFSDYINNLFPIPNREKFKISLCIPKEFKMNGQFWKPKKIE